jgi:hypothetical protein
VQLQNVFIGFARANALSALEQADVHISLIGSGVM